MSERVVYDEFGLLRGNAQEFGLPFDEPPVVRRVFVEVSPGRRLSALVWGSGAPELVLVHGGAQNAHTWDTVALALGRPLVAIDLPGHGHSDAPSSSSGSATAAGNAADLAAAISVLAPTAATVVGMSLGGASSVALAGIAPDLVRRLVLVDITPGVTGQKAKAILDFVNGPVSFPDFDDILARTIAHNPTRTVESLRRGILHNAVQQEDGSWVWRYRRFPAPADATPADATPADATPTDPRPDFAPLWDVLGAVTVPVMLVRGMLPQSVVTDEDEAELRRRLPDATVIHVAGAGHSVQGDTPLELARILDDFTPR